MASGTTYRLGGGGGLLNLNASSILAAGSSVEIGAINNFYQAQSVALSNGGGTVAINAPQSALNGNTVLNLGGILTIGDNAALGASTLVFNGGTIQPDTAGIPLLLAPRTISNGIVTTGDANFAGGANVDLILSGNIALSNSTMGGGVLRNFNTNAALNSNLVVLSGVISDNDGSGGTNNQLNKGGAGILALTNSNTYTGFTTISSGELVVSSDANTGLNSTVIFAGATTGALAVWNAPGGIFTSNKNYEILANSNPTFDIAAGQAMVEGPGGLIGGSGNLSKGGLGNLILTGANEFAAIFVNGGLLSAGNNVSLGDLGSNSLITLNGGNLLLTSSMLMTHTITGTNGSIDVVGAGTTVTTSGAIGGGNFIKTGLGTLVMNGINTDTGATFAGGGTVVAGTNQPFAASAATSVNLQGGTLSLPNLGVATSYVTGVLNYAGGGVLSLQDITIGANTYKDQFTLIGNGSAGIARTGATLQGTLSIRAVNGHLGASENLVSPVVLGLSTITQLGMLNNNGMVAASIVQVDGSGNADFVKYGTPAQGFTATTISRLSNFTGSTAGSIVDIAAASNQDLVGGTSTAYAVRTASDITDGTLQITSIQFGAGTASNIFEGGLLLNGSNQTIGANLFFGNTATTGYVAAPYPLTSTIGLVTAGAVGEGLVFVNNNATLSGQVVANNFTKFGDGSLTLSGNNLLAGNFAVQQGTVSFTNLASGPIAGTLVLNDLALWTSIAARRSRPIWWAASPACSEPLLAISPEPRASLATAAQPPTERWFSLALPQRPSRETLWMVSMAVTSRPSWCAVAAEL